MPHAPSPGFTLTQPRTPRSTEQESGPILTDRELFWSNPVRHSRFIVTISLSTSFGRCERQPLRDHVRSFSRNSSFVHSDTPAAVVTDRRNPPQEAPPMSRQHNEPTPEHAADQAPAPAPRSKRVKQWALFAPVLAVVAIAPWFVPWPHASSAAPSDDPSSMIKRAVVAANGSATTKPQAPSGKNVSNVTKAIDALGVKGYDAPVTAKDIANVSVKPGPYQVLGRLQIPSIHLDVKFGEGVDEASLAHGPGHWPGTPMPGRAGNTSSPGTGTPTPSRSSTSTSCTRATRSSSSTATRSRRPTRSAEPRSSRRPSTRTSSCGSRPTPRPGSSPCSPVTPRATRSTASSSRPTPTLSAPRRPPFRPSPVPPVPHSDPPIDLHSPVSPRR